MKILWTTKGQADITRLYGFLERVNKRAAITMAQQLVNAPTRILHPNPRIGTPLTQFEPREVRRILVNQYELHYKIKENTLYILCIWHTKEDR